MEKEHYVLKIRCWKTKENIKNPRHEIVLLILKYKRVDFLSSNLFIFYFKNILF